MNLVTVAPKAQIPTYRPSRAEERYIDQGLTFLTMTTPFWAAAYYAAMTIKFTKAVPYAATDSHTIYVNPQAMQEAGWTFEEVAFVIAHEVLHFLFGDLIMGVYWREQSAIILPDGTSLPYEHDTMGRAMDYRINACLIDGKVGKFPTIGLYDRTLSEKGMESCVEIYQKLLQQGGGSAGQQQPSGSGHGGFDQHIEPSQQAVEQDRAGGALKRAQVAASAQMVAEAAGMGKLPAALAALIGELLEPKVDWRDHLKASMNRAAGEPRHNWAKVNKRMISRPDHKIVFARREAYGCGTVVVGYDTSGSCINAETQRRFFTEMSAIVSDLNPERLIVIWCDAKVQRVDELEEPTDLEQLRADINEAGGAPGGGGTDLREIFNHIKDEHIAPDMLVVLTDMYTPFPGQPDYPVIWASINDKGKREPFGTLVEIPEE